MKKIIIQAMIIVLLFCSCQSGKTLTAEYYKQNEQSLLDLKKNFKKLHQQHPFSIEIKNRDFIDLGLEIITDTARYIYSIPVNGIAFRDTLQAYRFDTTGMLNLLSVMKKMQCTWITNLDYFENREAKYMVFLSLRHQQLGSGRKERYFTLAFFEQPQYFDEKGRLIDKGATKSPRKINGETFYKINDRVCYTLSGHFR